MHIQAETDADVVVIGGGIAGALTALALPSYMRVHLIEKGDRLLPEEGSTANSCFKLHTGLHYAGHLPTAEACLKASVVLIRAFPECVVKTEDETPDSPWRRFYHYIMSNSLVEPQEVRRVAEILKEQYRQLVAQEAENAVFGPPETFIQEIAVEACPHIAKDIPFVDKEGKHSIQHVALAFITSELQLNLPLFRSQLTARIQASGNITFRPLTKALSVQPDPDRFGYRISIQSQKAGADQEHITYISTATLVNCTWERVEVLDETAGIRRDKGTRTNRGKMSVTVALEGLPLPNTSIFSVGPYISLTSFPGESENTVILTAETTTNEADFAVGLDAVQEMDAYLASRNVEHANQIIETCASFFNSPYREALAQAPIRHIHRGFVKMINQKQAYRYETIFDKESSIHERLCNGVESIALGWVDNLALKMVYGQENALMASQLIEADFRWICVLNKLYVVVRDSLRLKSQHYNCYYSDVEVFLNINKDRAKLTSYLKRAVISKIHELYPNDAMNNDNILKRLTALDDSKIESMATQLTELLSPYFVNLKSMDSLIMDTYAQSVGEDASALLLERKSSGDCATPPSIKRVPSCSTRSRARSGSGANISTDLSPLHFFEEQYKKFGAIRRFPSLEDVVVAAVTVAAVGGGVGGTTDDKFPTSLIF